MASNARSLSLTHAATGSGSVKNRVKSSAGKYTGYPSESRTSRAMRVYFGKSDSLRRMIINSKLLTRHSEAV